jgi:hypothetical protein
VQKLLIASALSVIVSACSLPADRESRAYNVCLARHAQEAAVCEAPRQAYEVGPFSVQARSAAGGPATAYGFEEGSAVPSSSPGPALLHPSPPP